jgi:hypothetical protein
MAKTTLGPGDDIIVDGASVDEVLSKQQAFLPLAILSRSIVRQAIHEKGVERVAGISPRPESLSGKHDP